MAKDLTLSETPHSILEFESPSLALVAAPVAAGAGKVSWMVFAMVASLLTAAGLIPIDKVVTATGKVVSTEHTLVMQPLDVSIIRSINVHEGQLVHKGDLLATLDPTLAAADLSATQAQVASLKPELERLHDEATGQTYHAANPLDPNQALQEALFKQRHAQITALMENYDQKISGLETQIAGNLAQSNYYRQRLGLASGVEEMRRELERMQVGSKLNSLAAADVRVEMEREASQTAAAAESAKRDLAAMIAQRNSDRENWFAQVSQQIHDEGTKLDQANGLLEKAQLHRQMVEMRATQDAVVLTVERLSVGSVLQTGEQFITLIPLDAPLEVEAYISGSDAGFVHVGNPVEVKFDTFPYAVYGDAEGTVRLTSADSFVQPSGSRSSTSSESGSTMEATQQSSLPGTQVFYRDRITLDKIRLHDTPEGFRLMPGLTVTADIKVGKRTILGYLMGRVVPTFTTGMREP
ncbi:MAG: HlyD family type I secretion periplasmic adaptor subunit [Acidisphaera sp.]|nr:HlyD family type I secretion periplasmic adaptor subunit [Acidisphaera sp.]